MSHPILHRNFQIRTSYVVSFVWSEKVSSQNFKLIKLAAVGRKIMHRNSRCISYAQPRKIYYINLVSLIIFLKLIKLFIRQTFAYFMLHASKNNFFLSYPSLMREWKEELSCFDVKAKIPMEGKKKVYWLLNFNHISQSFLAFNRH